MRWADTPRRMRDGIGMMGSAGFTGLLFGLGPICALFWVFGSADRPEILLGAPGLDAEPVVLQWASLTDVAEEEGDEDGAGPGEDGPLKAGPDPDVGSNGDGSDEAIVDASGDEGEDDLTQQALDGVIPGKGNDDPRTARGQRRPGASAAEVFADRETAGALRRHTRRKTCNESHPDVSPTGQDAWTVNRNLVEYYTSNFKRFNSLGWSGPYDSEVIKGWKIGGFGCNSPLHFAGLRRGDIVLTINEKKTRTWIQIFGAYSRLKRQDQFEVVLIRRGKRKVLHYSLIDGGPPTTG